MVWRDKRRGAPDWIGQEELWNQQIEEQRRKEAGAAAGSQEKLKYRQIEDKRRKEAEAAAKSREHTFRKLYPRVEKLCKKLALHARGRFLKNQIDGFHKKRTFCISLSHHYPRDDYYWRDYREVYIDVCSSGVVLSIVCYTEPSFLKASKSGSANPFFKGRGYYRCLERFGTTDVHEWGRLAYYIPSDDFTEGELAEKLKELTEEVLKTEASIHPSPPSLWSTWFNEIYDVDALEAEIDDEKSRKFFSRFMSRGK